MRDILVTLFNIHYAVKITKDNKGNKFIFNMARWTKDVDLIFDLSQGVLVCNDSKGKELLLSTLLLLKIAET